jgi:hypothetical protein
MDRLFTCEAGEFCESVLNACEIDDKFTAFVSMIFISPLLLRKRTYHDASAIIEIKISTLKSSGS